MRMAVAGLATDDCSVGAYHEDTLLIRLPGGAAGIVQISYEPLSLLVAECVRVVNRPGHLDRTHLRRDIKGIPIFKSKIRNVRDGCEPGLHVQNDPACRLDRREPG